MNPASWFMLILGIGIFVILGIGNIIRLVKKKEDVGGFVVTMLVISAVAIVFIWAAFGFEKHIHTEQITKITIYNQNGEQIKVYEGDFNIVDSSKEYVLFEDENGAEHKVYISGMIEIEHIEKTLA